MVTRSRSRVRGALPAREAKSYTMNRGSDGHCRSSPALRICTAAPWSSSCRTRSNRREKSGRTAMKPPSALGIVLCVLGQPGLLSAQPVAGGGEPIVVGQRFQLRSPSMGEVRDYQVHRPADYDTGSARYPVVFVLEGEEHFQHVSTTVDLLSGAGRIPEMLVVGIPNVDRVRDMDSTAAPGSSAFLKFITAELVPKIDRDYRTRDHRHGPCTRHDLLRTARALPLGPDDRSCRRTRDSSGKRCRPARPADPRREDC